MGSGQLAFDDAVKVAYARLDAERRRVNSASSARPGSFCDLSLTDPFRHRSGDDETFVALCLEAIDMVNKSAPCCRPAALVSG